MTKKTQLKGTLILVLTAILWGASFVSQNEGVKSIDAIAFNGIRSFMGAFALIPVAVVTELIKRKRGTYIKPTKKENKTLLTGGICCGIALCTASTLQTMGVDAGAGVSAFITAMYIVFVPVFGLFLKQKVQFKVWVAVMLGMLGLYLICGSFKLKMNQIYLIACSVFFAVHILTVDYFSPKVNGVKLSCIQFFVVGIIDCTIMLFRGVPSFADVISCGGSLLYAGIVSCAVAYTLQIIGQQYTTPTAGSLAMSLESVFAVLSGWLVQGIGLKENEIIGCVIVFAAIILVQIPDGIFKRKNKINT